MPIAAFVSGISQAQPDLVKTLPGTADLAAGAVDFVLAPESDGRRKEYELFIAQRFSASYGASITEFFPLLLGRWDAGLITSVVGLRPGTQRPLFLEQYLDTDLETAISAATGKLVARNQLIEIGNLASVCKSGSQLLFILLTAVLSEAGFEWVVFTGTEQIRLLLKRLNFAPISLCEANPAKLLNKNQSWGSYYQSSPQVQAGNVTDALRILSANPYSRSLLHRHAGEIQRLARQLRVTGTVSEA